MVVVGDVVVDEKICYGGYVKIGYDFDQGVDLVFVVYGVYFQEGEVGVYG